ncbi:hypothetical protein K504DRAFT_487241 [Pleomassaria siparia CBS 279.74]|uniref:FAD/NAD(P)-binding domain-containing protein n=1 Tax=Pleomassaria siparia CBS 279.74 TaxID=1314801 RepID=A0A6G1KSR8_9PLEO|nr:hypothetical protein K504DRAFT_487241 [Pleomassaria siparia CBS 279.74]
MANPIPRCVDTVIIGNGPSALILSYILHGHIPYYIGGHHDPILDSKLSTRPNLLNLTPDLYAHFLSSLRYSTQALPINTLLDTLIRPNADTEINPTSCIEWRYEPEKAIPHVAIGQTPQAGGQWADNPVSASPDISTLSYAEQLSLPGYSYAEHAARNKKEDEGQCDFVRPSKTEVADYLKTYPEAVGISSSIFTGEKVDNVYRTSDGFTIGSLGIQCKHVVLASGIFMVNIPPPALLGPISKLDTVQEPLLVIGSGFSAADVIISAPSNRKVVHLFQWTPERRPSPLRGCHHTAYPEYATVYRQMKLAVIAASKTTNVRSPLMRRKSNPFVAQRDWSTYYEGFPNAQVLQVKREAGEEKATITIRLVSGDIITRSVGGLQYVVGRRGTLDFLAPKLRSEVMGTPATTEETTRTLISGHTLRAKSETSLEVAKAVFIIGSLAGDSLIRHAIGGCVFAAGRILGVLPSSCCSNSSQVSTCSSSTPRSVSPIPPFEPFPTPPTPPPPPPPPPPRSTPSTSTSVSAASTLDISPPVTTNGHVDLHLDRRKLAREVNKASAVNSVWVDSGWWAGGMGGGR